MQALVDQLRSIISSEPSPGPTGGPQASADLDPQNGLSRRSKTGYIGVTLHKRTQRFEAHIWSDKKQIYLGAYSNKSQAARAHDVAALKMRAAPTDLNFSDSDYVPIQPHLQALPQTEIVAALRSCSRSMPSRTNRQSSMQEGSASRSVEETASAHNESLAAEQPPAGTRARHTQNKSTRRKQARPTSALDTTDVDEDFPSPEIPDSLQLQAAPGTTRHRPPHPPPIKTRRGPSVAPAGTSRDAPTLFQNPTQHPNHSPPQLTTPVGSPRTRGRGVARPPVPPLFIGQRGANRELRAVRPSQLAIHPILPSSAAPPPVAVGLQSQGEPPAVSPRAIRAAKRSGIEAGLWGSVFGGASPGESPLSPKDVLVQGKNVAGAAVERVDADNSKSPFATPQRYGEVEKGE